MRVAFDGGKVDFQQAALHIRPLSQLTASAFIIHLAGLELFYSCWVASSLLSVKTKLNGTKPASSERCPIGNLKRGTTFWKNITLESL